MKYAKATITIIPKSTETTMSDVLAVFFINSTNNNLKIYAIIVINHNIIKLYFTLFPMFFDPIYFLFIAPGLLLGLIATILLKSWNKQYSQKQNVSHISGSELAARICQSRNIDIHFAVTDSELNDNYNPSDRTLTLSREVAYGTTVSAVAIAAHELGHVLQHKQKSPLILFRNLIIPAVNIGTNVGYILIIIGFVISALRISEIGLILFSLSTVFTLLTIPIEIDASTKALALLKDEQILYPDEIGGAKKVLAAAALTYVAALFQSIGQVLYFFFRIKDSD
jgi:Zn-dependent membrane protease YugP